MNILFIAPLKSTFVKNDISILSENHKLILENSDIGRGFKGLINLIKIIFRSFFRIFKSDAVFCWFGDYASLFPTLFGRLFRKPVYVVAGGFDVSYIPELNYGARARAFRWFCAKNSFRFATTVLPVSKFAENCLNERMKGKVNKSVVVYNCIDVEKLSLYKKAFERKIILTVSRADDYTEYILKGTDRFINIARKMPHRQFVIAGLQAQALELAQTEGGDLKNLKIIPGFLSLYDEIIPLYNQASAYVQLSLEESFGISVAEAMVFGCVPVITNKGGLPEVVGDKGIIVESDDDVINEIEKSFQYSQEERNELIEQSWHFSKDQRKLKINEIFNQILPYYCNALINYGIDVEKFEQKVKGQFQKVEIVEYDFKFGEVDLKSKILCSRILYNHRFKKSIEEFYDINSNIEETRLYSYDDRGYDSEYKTLNKDKKIKDWIKWINDENDNVIEEIYYNSDGTISHINKYKYDINNNEIEWIGYDSDNSIRGKRISNYDNKSNRLEVINLNFDGSIEEKTIYRYDDNGNEIERINFNVNDSILYKVHKRYNNKMLIEEVYYDVDAIIDYSIIYKYDDKGRNIEKITLNSDNTINTKFNEKFIDNDKGELIEYCLFLDDSIQYQFNYKYDENGNWSDIEMNNYSDEIRKLWKFIYKK